MQKTEENVVDTIFFFVYISYRKQLILYTRPDNIVYKTEKCAFKGIFRYCWQKNGSAIWEKTKQ